MSSADWYAKRLAQGRGGHAPPQAPQYPPTMPPGQLPPHLAPYAHPAPPQPAQGTPQAPPAGYGQQHAPMNPAEVLQMIQSGQIRGTSYTAEGAQVADDGHVAMLQYAATTGGSKQVRDNSETCPNCHMDTLFTIQSGGVWSKAVGGSVKAQQCGSCGWPKVQAGSTGGALSGSRGGGGPATPARQLPANHRVTVAVEGGGYATFEPPTSTGAR